MPSHEQTPPGRQRPVTPGNEAARRRRRWMDLIEELLGDARERGDFDHLEGTGKPLRLAENPYVGEKAMAYSLLKNNNLAPPEIERGKEIDAELARAEQLLVTLRRRRDALKMKWSSAFASERRTYNLLRSKTEGQYTEALKAINSKILSLNIVAPSALHRRRIDIDERLAAFRHEFPPLVE